MSLTRDNVSNVVHQVISEILPSVKRPQMTSRRHLKELGADSIDRVEIISLVIDRLGVTQPMSAFSDLPDIGSLIDFLWMVTQP